MLMALCPFMKREIVMSFLGPLTFVAYLGIGLLQQTTIMSGLQNWMGLNWLVATLVSFILAYVPFVGSTLGILGAVYGWGWSWIWATSLFCWPLVIVAVGMLGYATGSGITALRKA